VATKVFHVEHHVGPLNKEVWSELSFTLGGEPTRPTTNHSAISEPECERLLST